MNSFRIDAWGWSPEIASEIQDEFYLSQSGPSNPYAIILDPEQENCKVHFPYYNFDDDLMQSVFDVYRAQIADVTTDQGILLKIDQRISDYHTPYDLLLIDHFNLSFTSSGGIISAAAMQRSLIHRLYNDDEAWKDFKLYDKLIESAKINGDLRYRSLEMVSMPYNRLSSFYTKAFGGVFVFRGLPSKHPVMVFENEEFMKELPENSIKSIFIGDTEKLVELLISEELVEFDRPNREVLQVKINRVCETMFTKVFSQVYTNSEVIDFAHPGYKTFEKELITNKALGEEYVELNKALDLLKRDRLKSLDNVSLSIKPFLLTPFRWHQPEIKELVNLLLIKMNSIDFLEMYTNDEEAFFDHYVTWPETFKAFMEQKLLDN